jgi:hypothetical protein
MEDHEEIGTWRVLGVLRVVWHLRARSPARRARAWRAARNVPGPHRVTLPRRAAGTMQKTH